MCTCYGTEYNDRRMTRGQTTCSLVGTANELLSPYHILAVFFENDCSIDGLLKRAK